VYNLWNDDYDIMQMKLFTSASIGVLLICRKDTRFSTMQAIKSFSLLRIYKIKEPAIIAGSFIW